MSVRTRSRWLPGLLAALACAFGGVVFGDPVVFLASGVGLAYAAYGAVAGEPAPGSLVVERRVSDEEPRAGDDVRVVCEAVNAGDTHLPDVRIVDETPEGVAVVDGSPRAGGTLAPGESLAAAYTLRARRGDHEFGECVAVARTLTGAGELRETAGGGDPLTVRSGGDALALREQTESAVGRVETDDAGEGVAFHSVRAYQHGDPVKRVDWRRFARTGELSTVEYREERAATVVLVVDVRGESRRVRAPGESDTGRLSRDAAVELAGELLSRNDAVGVAVWGAAGGYLPPSRDREVAARSIERLLADPARVPEDLDLRLRGLWQPDTLTRHLPGNAQVVCCTPLADDRPVEAAETWMAHGHPVTVVSPDPAGDSHGGRVAALERRRRARELRGFGARVADWSPDEPLAGAVARAGTRWSR
ncbi:DUF58 domain-containing protein [Halobaculum lipolyticum]|uniref:DUF58 domain-containing protein n=1 Tax=Halobaculum lipolyticum TaxID=3032001 RepID=A0ABD5WHS0_9EURY|nr:DUF58 domain-containing protein [Halobaculum sp. DT31]